MYIRCHDERDGRDGPNGAREAEDLAGLSVIGAVWQGGGGPIRETMEESSPGPCLPSVLSTHTPPEPAFTSSARPWETHNATCPIIIDLHLSSVAAEAGRASLVPLVVLRHITGTRSLPNSESLGPLGGCARRAIGRGWSGLHKQCSAPCRFPAGPQRACAWPATSFAAEPWWPPSVESGERYLIG